jgi:hypothetical protein
MAGLGHPCHELHPVRQDRRSGGKSGSSSDRARKRKLRACMKGNLATEEEMPRSAADPEKA